MGVRYDCKETAVLTRRSGFYHRGFAGLLSALNRGAGIAIVRVGDPQQGGASQMTQTSNRFFDEIGRLMNDAAGAAQGVKREVDTVVRNQAEKILRDLDIVKREEFEAVKDMARLAREENEALKARIAALEAKLGSST
jgi:BMFP domain-containing protein YqiC